MGKNNSPKQIANKREFYELYNKGVLGNRALTWDSLKEIFASGWRERVCIRSKKGISRKKVAYNVPVEQVRGVIRDWEKAGYKEEDITFNQSMPDERLIIQGEARIMPWGYYLNYTTVKEPMNKAFEKERKFASALDALVLLKDALCPSSFADMETLFEIYPNSVIEFSSYSIPVGDIPNRNTIFWEVRDY